MRTWDLAGGEVKLVTCRGVLTTRNHGLLAFPVPVGWRRTGIQAPFLKRTLGRGSRGEVRVRAHPGDARDVLVEAGEHTVVVARVESELLARACHVLVAQVEALLEGLEDGNKFRGDRRFCIATRIQRSASQRVVDIPGILPVLFPSACPAVSASGRCPSHPALVADGGSGIAASFGEWTNALSKCALLAWRVGELSKETGREPVCVSDPRLWASIFSSIYVCKRSAHVRGLCIYAHVCATYMMQILLLRVVEEPSFRIEHGYGRRTRFAVSRVGRRPARVCLRRTRLVSAHLHGVWGRHGRQKVLGRRTGLQLDCSSRNTTCIKRHTPLWRCGRKLEAQTRRPSRTV